MTETGGDREVDVVVVGTGPGGEALALETAKAGLEVVAVDKHLVGGECPYFACIPTKMMLRAADTLAEADRAGLLAGDVSVVSSWAPVARRLSEEATDGWSDAAAVERLEKTGATVHHGTARLAGPKRVILEPTDGSDALTYTARRGVVLNTGTRPAEPPVDGLAGTPYWTNRDAVRVTELPGSLVILGGGPVGAELAQAFARFGVRVTIVQHGPRLLPRDEPEASQVLADVLVREGIRVMTGAEVTRVAYSDGFALTLASGEELTADRLLVATGRVPNLDDVGLDTVGLSPDSVEVDERLRAGDGLWVIGDITGHGAFTHMSMYQSGIAQKDILGVDGPPAAYHAVPHTTFTDPEVAGVGMTEQAARDAGLSVRTGSADWGSRGFTHGPGADGFVKVVEDAERGVLVGATAVGPYAGEVLSMLTLAVHAELPVDTLRSMIYTYPTFHRAVVTALSALE
ncbi:NAD(P)/FAD-dependent oxidoreductase [Nocardioides sp. KR10-350]|uniref:dihydrolipoyl dehydrogenase family protein n=1 Tax=Nocardioides cheoyonin TaxID=3156615 RepID=UPI0032B62446